MKQKRQFISIYFDDALVGNRKKRDITIAFDIEDPLYSVCKQMGSAGIKKIIGINCYAQLLAEAKKEDRTLGNFVKHTLRRKLNMTNE